LKYGIIGIVVGLAIVVSIVAFILGNPIIEAAGISASVSFALLAYDKLILTPNSRKRAYELRDLEKKLDAYGELIAILKITRRKSVAFWRENTSEDAKRLSHCVEQHEIRELDRLFGEKARSMSQKLCELWIEQFKRDTLEPIYKTRQSNPAPTEKEWQIPQFVMLDLREMQQVTESEYQQLKERWEKLAEIKLD